MIVGIGVDIVNVSRLWAALERTPALGARLFAESERGGRPESLAASFAAKEAVAKALGAPPGLRWTDVSVFRDVDGRPGLLVTGTVATLARQHGVRCWHLSLSHDSGMSIAMVVAEG